MNHDPLNQPVEVELKRTLDQLTRLRDETRLQIHLAEMNLTREFTRVEEEIEAATLAMVASTDAPRIAVLERLRAAEDALTRIARAIPGGP